MTTCYASKTRPHPKTIAPNLYTHTNPYIPQSESAVIHPKILTRKSESVLIHSEKISQITALGHSYIIVDCKTSGRNVQKLGRICQTESSKCKNEILVCGKTAQIRKNDFVHPTKAPLTKNRQVTRELSRINKNAV